MPIFIHRIICRIFGQHSLYRVYEESETNQAHMKRRFCGISEWYSNGDYLGTPAPWPKPPATARIGAALYRGTEQENKSIKRAKLV